MTRKTRRRNLSQEDADLGMLQWRRSLIIVSVIGSSLGILTVGLAGVKLIIDAALKPINDRITAETDQRKDDVKSLGKQMEKVAQMVMVPDSSARVVLLQNVQELGRERDAKQDAEKDAQNKK